jgi:hypothetical protein
MRRWWWSAWARCHCKDDHLPVTRLRGSEERRVTSDRGWSADLVYLRGRWKVARTLDNWERCADGISAPGEQAFTFWPNFANKSELIDWDQTIGPSGACGVNRWLNITMPLRLTPVG